MSLLNDLSSAKTEEEVKDAYVKAIGLKSPGKGKVDISAHNMWFEAKEAPTAAFAMFAQLLFYVREARLKGEHIPPFLCVIDREKAAILETELALPVIADDGIDWPKAASAVSKACIAKVAAHIDGQFSTFAIASQESEFLTQIKSALNDGKIIRTPITPDNLRQVFNKWVEMVGREMVVPHEGDYASLFFADIMHDGDAEAMTGLSARLLKNAGKPVFLMKDGRTFEPASLRGYNNFWRIYHRPPETRHRHYLLERRDILLPFDEQKFKGAYYTPPHIVDKAYDLLAQTLGEGWQEEYIIWDMCCGVGNLELAHSNPRNLFMSTLDQEDIDGMKSRGTFAGVEMFQYDYLNDDVTDFGEIDYSLTSKLPTALRQALADAKAGKVGAKKILVLINPPYVEAMNVENTKEDGLRSGMKTGVAQTQVGARIRGLGYAARELFTQFVQRAKFEMPNATLAMFSKLKYVNAPNFKDFRLRWTAAYLDGFIVHSKAFDGLKGEFPIGFLIWDMSREEKTTSVRTVSLNRAGEEIGEKIFYFENPRPSLATWIVRPRSNDTPALPLKNALIPTTSTKDVRGDYWADDAIGSMICFGNDFQHASTTALLSSGYGNAGAFFVTGDNLWKSAIVFAVRRLIKPTWLNDRDQFLQPSAPLTEDFKSDCLIWMLFNGSNLSAGANGLEWKDRTWSLTNHFIPFTESEVGATGRFESDFMARYIKGMVFSSQAQAVLDEGRALWSRFHATNFPRTIRDEYRIGRADAGWYQIRKALEANSENAPVDFSTFKSAYAALGDKLRPKVFELGFLPT